METEDSKQGQESDAASAEALILLQIVDSSQWRRRVLNKAQGSDALSPEGLIPLMTLPSIGFKTNDKEMMQKVQKP